MIKKIILHIGHAKTATTSIQDTFKYNCQMLDNYGYTYPIYISRAHHNRLFALLFKEDLEQDEKCLLTHTLQPSTVEGARNEARNWLLGELLNSQANTFIFSGESFPRFNDSELEAIKAFFNKTLGEVEFEIYAYTRDPVSYASSLYQQQARLFPSDTKVIYFQYQELFGRYLKAFGEKSMNLFRFEDACKHPKGPVCFLLNKMALKDELIDQMQIINSNKSISNMAVDLLTYINREIPVTESSLNSGQRNRRDCKHLRSLPGRKFQLPEKDIFEVKDKTRSNMMWLNERFNISYPVNHQSPDNIKLEFDDNYVEKMITVLRKCNPIIKRLVYDYIKRSSSEDDLGENSQNNLLILESHFKKHHYLATKLSYQQISNYLWVRSCLHRCLKGLSLR